MSIIRFALIASTVGLSAAASVVAANAGAIAVPLAGFAPSVVQQHAAQLDELVRALGSSDPRTRACAVLALGELHDRAAAAVPDMVRLLGDMTRVEHLDCFDRERGADSDTSSEVGELAAVALSQVGAAGVDGLLSAVGDADANVREHTVFGLALSSSSRAVEPLVHALGDGEVRVRARAAWGLGLVGDGRSVAPLAEALRDPSDEVRAHAAWALGLKGDRDSVEPLIGALDDTSSEVRMQATWALGLRQDGRAVDRLIPLLSDRSVKVRRHAAWSLGMIGDRRASGPLTAALKADDAEVRKTAAWALGMIGLRGGGDAR